MLLYVWVVVGKGILHFSCFLQDYNTINKKQLLHKHMRNSKLLMQVLELFGCGGGEGSGQQCQKCTLQCNLQLF